MENSASHDILSAAAVRARDKNPITNLHMHPSPDTWARPEGTSFAGGYLQTHTCTHLHCKHDILDVILLGCVLRENDFPLGMEFCFENIKFVFEARVQLKTW